MEYSESDDGNKLQNWRANSGTGDAVPVKESQEVFVNALTGVVISSYQRRNG